MPPKKKQPVTPDEVLAKYFKIKNQYEKNLHHGRDNINKNRKLSVKEKEKKLKEFVPPCINCKSPEGNIFSENGRIFKVICGSTTQPCNLRVEVAVGKKQHIDDILGVAEEAVSEIKEKIIKLKLDITYNYKTEQEVQVQFNQLKSEYDKFQLVLEEIINMKHNFIDEKQRKEHLIALNGRKDAIIENFANITNVYNETRDSSRITEIIKEYQDVFLPLLEEIKQTKYRDVYVMKELICPTISLA